jgi:hypothetical protein
MVKLLQHCRGTVLNVDVDVDVGGCARYTLVSSPVRVVNSTALTPGLGALNRLWPWLLYRPAALSVVVVPLMLAGLRLPHHVGATG